MSSLGVTRPPASRSVRAQRRGAVLARMLEIVERRLGEGETFAELSVEQLASEAGISRTTFYVYFEDKADILRAWFIAFTDQLVAAGQDWWSLGPTLTRGDVHRALEGIVAAYRPHTTLMAATHDAVASDAATRELVQAAWHSYVEGLRRHILAGQAAGFIDPTLHPAETAFWLQWMAERGLHQTRASAGADELKRLVQAYTAIVWNTLYAPARRQDT